MKNLELLMTLITQQRNFKDKLVISGHKCQELVNQWETNSKQYIRVLNKTVWNTRVKS
jgi:hypothetical protein